jgi:hypothetical protein
VPRKLFEGTDCVCIHENGEDDKEACELKRRRKNFNFKMFPWHRNGEDMDPFTVFGDLGLKKPNERIKDKEKIEFLNSTSYISSWDIN